MNTTDLLEKLIRGQNLTTKETKSFLGDVMQNITPPAQIAAILIALRIKGESVEEITGLIEAIRKHMVKVNMPGAIDVCGTGGDGSGTFNISTAVAFVVAGAGIPVAKHGNRAASSKCGSADVLEELGVNLQLSPEETQKVFRKIGMIFFFAPLFHPTLKNLVVVRKELQVRTVFNFLGPFINPAGVKKQLIGVPNREIAQKLAEVGKKLNYEHLLIVTSEDKLDEISISSKSILFEVKNNIIKEFTVNPINYGFQKSSNKDVAGGNVKENAKCIKEILEGKRSPKRDIVVFNSAFALYVAEAVADVKEGIQLAEQSIDSGKAKLVLQNLIKETQKYA